ncbi:MAG: AAA family ATPase [Spirochaetes bacterium GWD1_27_9]|nr:MAG: AAA family ATPase [Spirochaetes bacterium GWB1_27_13]OHD26823.1 MAG: AAA family ATPase [Spirochaetes bacterium GWC1_27_15]OHD35375.1 MAG: AAA family ATPase [Spirochaetes bacterium GWD1_27_9]
MEMQKLFYTFNPWWDEGYVFEIRKREKYLKKIFKNMDSKDIILLAGLIRVGKSSIMKLVINELIKKGIDKTRILFVSLDDFLLNDKSIFGIIDEYRLLHKIKMEEKIYLFLDEITYKDKWQQQLKNMYDRDNVKIIASSSSSSIFIDENAYLTGRNRVIEVKPLDFDEWLDFKEIKLKIVDFDLMKAYFDDYLQDGGMPEYVIKKDRVYIQNLVEQLIYKDIIAKHNIKMKSVIQDLFLLLMERSGKQLSINNIGNILKITSSNAKRYIEYFEDTFLIGLIKKYGKTNEKITSQSKLYTGDIGIRNAYTGYRDKGSVFENYVYIKIKEKNPYYYVENGIELDFITDRYFGEQYLIECKYNSELNDKQRELFDKINVKNKIILNGYKDLHLIENI